ncbi:hypothetical protein ACFCX4_35300 [Kitasatospora sp. NPDC056327]|uniref:hypothetical protein n=1 Tax=Kitasatospora sp. NPDC056327 TaxID=3345785 RepID=UPI0035D7029A
MSDERRPAGDGARKAGGGSGSAGSAAGSGPGGSATERLLREALAARADRVTARDLRPVGPPAGPRLRRRPAHLIGLPLMGLAAATALAVLTVPTDTLANRGDTPAATGSGSPEPGADQDRPPPTGLPTPSGGTARPGGAGTGPAGGPGTYPDPQDSPGGGGPARTPAGTAPGEPFAPRPSADGTARPDRGIALSFAGPAGREAVVGAGPTAFSVTWHNTTRHTYETVAPVVAVRALADPVGTGRTVRGRLQREDGDGGWTDVPLTEGSGAYLASGDAAAFALAPGASRTVGYRLYPSIDSGEGTLLIEALALLPAVPQRAEAGAAMTAVLLTSAPAAARTAPEFTTDPAPAAVGPDRRPASFTMTVRNPGAAPLASVVPTVVLSGAEAGGAVTVEAGYGADGVRTLPVTRDAGGQLVVDTSLLERLVRPYGSTAFSFWITLPGGSAPAPGDPAVVVGAEGDGRAAAPAVIHPRFLYGGGTP